MYNNFIKPDIAGLEKSTNRGKNKRESILNVLNNLESGVFDGAYLNHSDKPSESEESIAERTKLGRQRFDEIANKEKIITFELFKKYFGYLSPSDMYKALNETTGSKENKDQINTIENRLINLMEVLQITLQMIEKKLKTETAC